MAFRRNNGSQGNNQQQNDSGENPKWKAGGFVNLYLPTRDGGRRKLGAVPLRLSNQRENVLREWLDKDPQGNSEKLASQLIVEYQSSEQSEDGNFDLPE